MINYGKDAATPLALWRGAGGEVFNVRAVEWKQRRALLKEAVVHCQPDLVIVDGIRDLMNDINDGVLAQEVMEELLHRLRAAPEQGLGGSQPAGMDRHGADEQGVRGVCLREADATAHLQGGADADA